MKYTDKLKKLRFVLGVKLSPGTTIHDTGGGFGGNQVPVETLPIDMQPCMQGSLSIIQQKICEYCTYLNSKIPTSTKALREGPIREKIQKGITDFSQNNPYCGGLNLSDSKIGSFIDEYLNEWLKELNQNDDFISYRNEHNKIFSANDPFVDKSSNKFGLYIYDCNKARDGGNTLTERVQIAVRLKNMISRLPKPPSVLTDPTIVDPKIATDIIERAIDNQKFIAKYVPEYIKVRIANIANANASNLFSEICGALGFGSPSIAKVKLAAAMEQCLLEWANSQDSKRPCMILSSGGIIMSSSDEWLASILVSCAKEKIKQAQDSCGK